jgi:hypothetical protein
MDSTRKTKCTEHWREREKKTSRKETRHLVKMEGHLFYLNEQIIFEPIHTNPAGGLSQLTNIAMLLARVKVHGRYGIETLCSSVLFCSFNPAFVRSKRLRNVLNGQGHINGSGQNDFFLKKTPDWLRDSAFTG